MKKYGENISGGKKMPRPAEQKIFCSKDDGYRGAWHAQPPLFKHGYKYSGGLGTYCSSHSPFAIFAKEVNKTFFCWGGMAKGQSFRPRNWDFCTGQQLHMVSYYDHNTGLVPRPTILFDKYCADTHDNPVISIDGNGHIWIFSPSHGGWTTPSFIHRSVEPYSIEKFETVSETLFAYPQPHWLEKHGFIFLHTRYQDGRMLHLQRSEDGKKWSEPQALAGIEQGHYHLSESNDGEIMLAFNFHPEIGGLDARTNIYLMKSDDAGRTWKNIADEKLTLPLCEIRKGQTQVHIPNIPLSTDWFTKIGIAIRSPGSAPIKVGMRKFGAPYNYYGQRDLTALPEWSRHEILVPPVANDPAASLMIEIESPSVVEIDDVSIEYLSPDEVAGSNDMKGNLLRTSSFPDGISAPWHPFHECYRPEHYQTDTEVIGPTGQPALRIITIPYEPNKQIAAITSPFFGMGGRYYTMSFWAKAENSGHTLNMRMGPPSEKLWTEPYQKVITLGKEWKRFKHSVKIPYSPDPCFVMQIFNWGPTGTFWIDGVQVELGENASDFKRTAKVEAVVQPEAPYGLVPEGEIFNLRLTVYDEIEEGMKLKSELYDINGNAYPLPDISLTAGKTFKTKFSVPKLGEPDFGSYRLEYRVVDKNGKDASKIGEVLLHRVRNAKFANELRPDSPFGIHITPNSEMPAIARKLGFTWVRMFGIYWQSVEREKGHWNFAGLDKMINNLHSANLCLLGILEGVPEWARVWVMPNPPPKGYNNFHAKNVLPKDPNDYKEYAKRMAENYKGKIQAFETWNEPFLPGFLNIGWENGAYIHPPPELFLKVHKAAAKGIKEGNHNAKVVFNAGAHYHAPSDKWTKELFNKGIFDTIDVVSYHSYQSSGVGYPGDPLYIATAANSNPNNPQMQVWNTEGGPGPSDIRNFYRHSPPLGKTDRSAFWGDYLVRYWVSTLASGADKFFLYLLFGWGEYTASYSMMNVDGRLHPCLTAFSNLAWHLEGKKYVKTHELFPGLFLYLFEGDGDTVGIVLSKGVARQELAIPANPIKVRDLFGNDLKSPVKLGDYAVFFEGKGIDSERMLAALGVKTVVEEEKTKPPKTFWEKFLGIFGL